MDGTVNKENRLFWEDGKDYNDYVLEELADRRKDAWKRQINQHLPQDKGLRILDVGCGPGFFSCILAEEGHQTVGIDRSADMLRHALANADRLKVHPAFLQMDAKELSFADNSFDVIISRNVTWTFEEPERVYAEFYRTLAPKGTLLIYDANWHIPFYHPELMEQVRENENWYRESFGHDFRIYDENTAIFEGLPLSDAIRPEWDKKALLKQGFQAVRTDLKAGDAVYLDWEKKLYSATPLFEISAKKI